MNSYRQSSGMKSPCAWWHRSVNHDGASSAGSRTSRAASRRRYVFASAASFAIRSGCVVIGGVSEEGGLVGPDGELLGQRRLPLPLAVGGAAPAQVVAAGLAGHRQARGAKAVDGAHGSHLAP